MATIQITEDERNLSGKALLEFTLYEPLIDSAEHMLQTSAVLSLPPMRRLQIEHAHWQRRALDMRADSSMPILNLGIVEEACWELPVAIEADDRDEMFDALGDILIFTCGVCTQLRMDFQTLTRDFDPEGLERPEGLDGIMNLYKAIGMIAHVVVHWKQYRRGYDDIAKVREDGGASIARLCAAVHWLCFSNDWEASVLFQEVITKMMAKRDWTKNAIDGETAKA